MQRREEMQASARARAIGTRAQLVQNERDPPVCEAAE